MEASADLAYGRIDELELRGGPEPGAEGTGDRVAPFPLGGLGRQQRPHPHGRSERAGEAAEVPGREALQEDAPDRPPRPQAHVRLHVSSHREPSLSSEKTIRKGTAEVVGSSPDKSPGFLG